MNNKEKKTHSMKARGMISDVVVHVVLALLAIVWVFRFCGCTLKLQYTERILCYQLFPKGIYAS